MKQVQTRLSYQQNRFDMDQMVWTLRHSYTFALLSSANKIGKLFITYKKTDV